MPGAADEMEPGATRNGLAPGCLPFFCATLTYTSSATGKWKAPFLSKDVGDSPERAADPLPAIDPRRLQEALDELPEGFRSPIILFYFEDFSYRDIADQMQIPIGTVMLAWPGEVVFAKPPCAAAGSPGRPTRKGGRVMDCQNARLLLYFVRTGRARSVGTGSPGQPPRRLSGLRGGAARREPPRCCPGNGRRPLVPFPAGLKERILKQLARARRPRPWPWVAAAVVLLAAAVTGFAILANGPVELNSTLIVAKADIKTSPEAVAWFSSRGSTAAPPAFNFNLLDTIDIAQIQGRQVAKLTFLSRADNRAAHVYVLSSSQFESCRLSR